MALNVYKHSKACVIDRISCTDIHSQLDSISFELANERLPSSEDPPMPYIMSPPILNTVNLLYSTNF